MNNQYREARQIIEEARRELDSILAKEPGTKGEENKEAYFLLEDLAERLSRSRDYLDYLNAPTKEGVLRESESGKFYVEFTDGAESHLLSCGNSLELLLDDEWIIARVEAKNGKYYFYNGDKPYLSEGMRARLRTI